jgi:hypothetical protein
MYKRKDFLNKYVKISLPDEEKDICFYCGEMATVVDHVPPFVDYSFFNCGFLIPSCRECNSYLSDIYFETIEERVKYIKNKLNTKYRHILDTPNWEEEELKNMGENFCREIKGMLKLKQITKERIKYYSSFFNVYKHIKLYPPNFDTKSNTF